MTLKEKFYPYCDNEYSEKWVNAEYCEDVADEFAIGFMNWCIKNCHVEGIFTGILNDKELLEMYKKEKRL
jgi:hypothetical protein